MNQFNLIKLRIFLVIVGLILVPQFSKRAVAAKIRPETAPGCSVAHQKATPEIGNAGCFIQAAKKVLMPRHKPTSKWNLPGGTSEPGETAQCTAHRETWEETGLDVVVEGLIHKFEKNGFYLYRCQLKTPGIDPQTPVPLPEWSKTEVLEIRWIDPRELQATEYRFPAQLKFIVGLVGR